MSSLGSFIRSPIGAQELRDILLLRGSHFYRNDSKCFTSKSGSKIFLRLALFRSPVVMCLLLLLTKLGACPAFGQFFSGGDSSKRIVFSANVEGNWDLFVVDEDGRNVVRLTKIPYDENTPAWSPSREEIIYASSDGELNIISVENKESRRVLVKGKEGKKVEPSFSPDGKSIIFVHLKPGAMDDTEVCTYDLEKGSSRTVIDQCGTQYFPQWSKGNGQVVYTHTQCSSGCGHLIQELWVADPRGGDARQLLMTNSLCTHPIWSPDGRKVAFTSDKTGNLDIWTYSVEDSRLEQVTKDPNLDASPAWSSDGSKIAFISARSGKMGIWVKDLATGREDAINPFPGKDVECKDVAW